MKLKYALITPIALSLVLGPIAMAQDSARNDSPKTAIKDSAITAKIKTKLAAEHLSSLGKLRVDTDDNGVVWLRGTTRTEAEADRAIEIARNTEGVNSVKSDIRVKPE